MDLNPRRILRRIDRKIAYTPPERLAMFTDWLSVAALTAWSALLLTKTVVLYDNPDSAMRHVHAWPLLLVYIFFDLIGDDIRRYIEKHENEDRNDKTEQIERKQR